MKSYLAEKLRRLKSYKKCRTMASLFLLAVCLQQTAGLAAPNFQQAVADYNSGKYRQALPTFQAFASAYPQNALVHYYLGMCQLSLNHRGEARAEFQWVAQHGDANLASQSQRALQSLGAVGSNSNDGAALAYAPPSPSGPAAGSSSKPAGQKVKKILEFYADW